MFRLSSLDVGFRRGFSKSISGSMMPEPEPDPDGNDDDVGDCVRDDENDSCFSSA